MSIAEKLATAAENITRFEAEIVSKTVEITLPDGYIYTALATTLPAATFDSSGEHDVSFYHVSRDILDGTGWTIVDAELVSKRTSLDLNGKAAASAHCKRGGAADRLFIRAQ